MPNTKAMIVLYPYNESLDKNKHPLEGLGIREMTTIDYDYADALKWAMETKLAVALDKKAFEKIALATPASLPFVKVDKVPEATVATDLSKWLPKENESAK